LLHEWFRRYSYLYNRKLSAKKPRECILVGRVQCTPWVSRHSIFSSTNEGIYLIVVQTKVWSLPLWIGYLTCLFINERSLEITLTVPVNQFYTIFNLSKLSPQKLCLRRRGLGAPIFSCVNEERVKMKGHGNFGKTNYTMKVIKDFVF